LMRLLSGIHGDDALTAPYGAVRQRPEFNKRRDPGIYTHIDKTAAGTSGQETSPRVRVGNSDNSGFAKMLLQAFVVGEEKHPVALDRPSNGSAELIAMKRRDRICRPVEIVLRVHGTVAKELVCCAMKVISPGLCNRVHDLAVAAILRDVRVGKNLKLRDGVNTHGSPNDAGAGAAVEIILNVCAVQNLCLSVR